MRKSFLIFMFVFSILIGCASFQRPSEATDAAPSITPKPINTAQPLSNSNTGFTYEKNCINIQNQYPDNYKSQGFVVAYDRVSIPNANVLGYRDTVFIDPFTADIQKVVESQNPYLFIKISPDNHKIAYYRPEENLLEVADIKNGVLASFPWNNDKWLYITDWLDNHNIIIKLNNNNSNDLLILNTTTGEEKIINYDFPNIYMLERQFDWNGWGKTVYNSTLTRAVYASYHESFYEYTLWDLNTNMEMASLRPVNTITSFSRSPIWSPDASKALIIAPTESSNHNGEELFYFTSDGDVVQITNLSDFFASAVITRASWSPNGRYIAFYVLVPEHPSDEELVIYDISSQKAINSCIPGLQISEYHPLFPVKTSTFIEILSPPIWSPDSSYLIIENRFALDKSRLVLVDVSHKLATEIGENLEPVGWIIGP